MPIPGNDDAIRSVKLIVSKLADAIYEARHGAVPVAEEYDYDSAEDEYEDDADEA